MATTFLRVKGIFAGDNCWATDRELSLTSFFGGPAGRCIQVTCDGEGKSAFVGLDVVAVQKLVHGLVAWLDGVSSEELDIRFHGEGG